LLEAEASIEIVGECITGAETVGAIQRASPHVVLLDVGMPELDGFQVLQTLGHNPLPAIIFVTAHAQFAIRAFEAAAIDYLLKPFDRDRLQKALGRAREIVQRGHVQPPVEKIVDLLGELQVRSKLAERFAVRLGRRILFVKPEEIDWIRSANNYSELHVGEHVYLLRQTLAELERQLARSQFVRVSRSLMVNADRIQELRAKSHGDYRLLLKGGPELTGSRNYRVELNRLIGRTSAF
jgi:two-component system LytT family response regulator